MARNRPVCSANRCQALAQSGRVARSGSASSALTKRCTIARAGSAFRPPPSAFVSCSISRWRPCGTCSVRIVRSTSAAAWPSCHSGQAGWKKLFPSTASNCPKGQSSSSSCTSPAKARNAGERSNGWPPSNTTGMPQPAENLVHQSADLLRRAEDDGDISRSAPRRRPTVA